MMFQKEKRVAKIYRFPVTSQPSKNVLLYCLLLETRQILCALGEESRGKIKFKNFYSFLGMHHVHRTC